MRRLLLITAALGLLGWVDAHAAEPVQTCPGIAPGSIYTACKAFKCAVPTSNEDMVQTQVVGVSKTWVKLATVPPSGLLVQCLANGGYAWRTRAQLGIGVITPTIVLYPYNVTWTLATENVDGSALTNLTGSRVENSGDPAGPWVGNEVPAGVARLVLNLPSSVRQCFRVVSIAGAKFSTPSDPPFCVDPVSSTPKPPTDVAAQKGPDPVQ